jgi:hypothetical protein
MGGADMGGLTDAAKIEAILNPCPTSYSHFEAGDLRPIPCELPNGHEASHVFHDEGGQACHFERDGSCFVIEDIERTLDCDEQPYHL